MNTFIMSQIDPTFTSFLITTFNYLRKYYRIPLDNIKQAYSQMEEKTYRRKEVVFNKGDQSENFYIIQKGSVLIQEEINEDEFQTKVILKEGFTFGDFELIEGKTRNNTVIVNENQTTLLVLSKGNFMKYFCKFFVIAENERKINLMKNIPPFLKLTTSKFQKLYDNFIFISYNKGDTIFHAGDEATCLIFLLLGECSIKSNNDVIMTVNKFDLCGLEAIYSNDPGYMAKYSYSLIAKETCSIIKIRFKLLGGLMNKVKESLVELKKNKFKTLKSLGKEIDKKNKKFKIIYRDKEIGNKIKNSFGLEITKFKIPNIRKLIKENKKTPANSKHLLKMKVKIPEKHVHVNSCFITSSSYFPKIEEEEKQQHPLEHLTLETKTIEDEDESPISPRKNNKERESSCVITRMTTHSPRKTVSFLPLFTDQPRTPTQEGFSPLTTNTGSHQKFSWYRGRFMANNSEENENNNRPRTSRERKLALKKEKTDFKRRSAKKQSIIDSLKCYRKMLEDKKEKNADKNLEYSLMLNKFHQKGTIRQPVFNERDRRFVYNSVLRHEQGIWESKKKKKTKKIIKDKTTKNEMKLLRLDNVEKANSELNYDTGCFSIPLFVTLNDNSTPYSPLTTRKSYLN